MEQTIEVRSNGVRLELPMSKWMALIKEHSQVNEIKQGLGLRNNGAVAGKKRTRTVWTDQMIQILKDGLGAGKSQTAIGKELGIKTRAVLTKTISLKKNATV